MALPAPVQGKTKIRLIQEFENGKNPVQVLHELGYKEKEHFWCTETDRPTGVGSIKIFICKFTVNGCPAFPEGEGPSKKKAKENAARPVASYLLGTGPTKLVNPTATLPAASSPGGRLVTDSGKTAKLREEYRNDTGTKSAAAILHEYAVLKDLEKPKSEECPSPNPGMSFGCFWRIGNVKYPVGAGRSKQEAKQTAAKNALDIIFVKTDANPSPKSERKQGDPSPPKPKQQPAPVPVPVSLPAPLPPGPVPVPPSDISDDIVYRMSSNPRGYVLLINNVNFPHNNKEPFREGSDKDAEALTSVFSSLGFKVIQKRDLTGASMFATIRTFARSEDHEKVDSSVLIILSHGANGSVLGTDNKEVKVDLITTQFYSSNAKALAGKPKLFLFQACRGENEDFVVTDGVVGKLQVDSAARLPQRETTLSTDHYTKKGECIPERADLLVCHSTNAGMMAYRYEGTGSIFVQKFCEVLSKYASSLEMSQILTRVNGGVSEFEAVRERENDTVKVKQISEFRSTLRKLWKL